MAPDIIRLSNTLRFTARRSTLEVKSNNESNVLSLSRANKICSKAFVPTFLMAFKPYEIVFSLTGLKWMSETFTSGASTVILSFRHSLIRITTRSILDISLVRFAAMNSAA